MNSNFSVKIDVDITSLNERLKTVEQTLGKLSNSANTAGSNIKSSFDTAASSVQKVGMDMNRARLATFAFGQVIRDAGFFSQSFGLGVLAISNNIPILIDQLVLLSGVSAGFGSVLSVLGSLLAAGATVFAYWAQGVERDGGSISGAIRKMGDDSESAISKLINFLSTPPASNMLSEAVSGLEESVTLIKQIMSAAVDFSIAVWSQFGGDISSVFKTFYGIVYNTMNNVLNIFRFASSVIKGDFGGAFEAIQNIAKNVINNLISLVQAFVKVSSTLLGNIVGVIDPLKGEVIKNAGKELVLLGENLKFSSTAAETAQFSFRDFFNDLFSVEKQADKTGKSVDKLNKIIKEPSLPKSAYGRMSYESLPGLVTPRLPNQVKPTTLKTDYKREFTDLQMLLFEMIPTVGEITLSIVDQIGAGFQDILTEFANGIGMLISGDIGVGQLGQNILKSMGSFLSQLGKQLVAFGTATIAYGIAQKVLQSPTDPGSKIAAGGALIAAGIALGAIGAAINKTAGGGSPTSGAGSTPTFGGNYGGRASSMGPAGLAYLYGGMNGSLETRVSGNDLVILMNRANRNRRGNY